MLADISSLTKAFAVPQKGVDAEGTAVKNLLDNILWLGHARAAVQSDNEPVILKLLNTMVNLLKLSGVNVTVEGSAEYDPQSNEAAETAVCLGKGQVKALQVGLENDIKSHIRRPSGYHIACAASSHGEDDASRRGRWEDWMATCTRGDLQAEVARYKCRSQKGRIG